MQLVSTVSDSWNAADPGRPIGMKLVFTSLWSRRKADTWLCRFVGSDDFLRAKFEEYICSALAAIKFMDFLAKGKDASVLISGAGEPS